MKRQQLNHQVRPLQQQVCFNQYLFQNNLTL